MLGPAPRTIRYTPVTCVIDLYEWLSLVHGRNTRGPHTLHETNARIPIALSDAIIQPICTATCVAFTTGTVMTIARFTHVTTVVRQYVSSPADGLLIVTACIHQCCPTSQRQCVPRIMKRCMCVDKAADRV